MGYSMAVMKHGKTGEMALILYPDTYKAGNIPKGNIESTGVRIVASDNANLKSLKGYYYRVIVFDQTDVDMIMEKYNEDLFLLEEDFRTEVMGSVRNYFDGKELLKELE